MRSRTIIAVALLLWVATAVVLLAGDWYMTCTVDGQDLGGIDCFQANTTPRAGAAPARWFGFVPLVAVWASTTIALAWSAIVTLRR